MQQVPTYLIIGDGRLAKHLGFYFDVSGIHYINWSRKSQKNLNELFLECTHVLIAITDSAIVNFINEHDFLKSKTIIHFSGATEVDGAYAFHPLMTFSDDLYNKEFYQTIPFVSFDNSLSFKDVFPALNNTCTEIDKKLMPYYHSLCVMGGNFTTLLWAKCSEAFSEIGIDNDMIKPYMQKVFENTLADPISNLTGPLIRKDQVTIDKNIKSITDYKMQNLYKSFVDISQDMEL